MKKIITLVALAALFAACGTGKSTKNAQADSLAQVVILKDSLINDAFNSLSDIAANLTQIAEREKLITNQTSGSGELSKSTKDQIAENIAAISGLLEKNRETISRLQTSTNRLREANVQIESLQKLVAQLQEQLNQKDTQLAELAEQVKSLKIEIAALGRTVTDLEGDKAELQGTLADQDAALHTVYYIVGQEKELMKNDIIDKKGFIGRTRVLGDNADMAEFTKSDSRTLERIPIGGKRVKIVSGHPESSYTLVMSDRNTVEELVINDKDAFWKSSKILVVSHR